MGKGSGFPGRLFGARSAAPAADRPRLDVVIGDEGEGEAEAFGDSTVDYPRGERGGLMVTVSAPNLQFVANNPRGAERMKHLESIGFRFTVRLFGDAEVASVEAPISVELSSVEDLIDLQRRIGLPLRLEDGMLEVTT